MVRKQVIKNNDLNWYLSLQGDCVYFRLFWLNSGLEGVTLFTMILGWLDDYSDQIKERFCWNRLTEINATSVFSSVDKLIILHCVTGTMLTQLPHLEKVFQWESKGFISLQRRDLRCTDPNAVWHTPNINSIQLKNLWAFVYSNSPPRSTDTHKEKGKSYFSYSFFQMHAV